ncbi:MAG TPA: hypothetical protein VFC38_06575 [Stellaceae bacterium]|nr:hypothetical protein [Stellaceae bacterium]
MNAPFLDEAAATDGALRAGTDTGLGLAFFHAARAFPLAALAYFLAQRRQRPIEPGMRMAEGRSQHGGDIGGIEQQFDQHAGIAAINAVKRRGEIKAGTVANLTPLNAIFAFLPLELLQEIGLRLRQLASEHGVLLWGTASTQINAGGGFSGRQKRRGRDRTALFAPWFQSTERRIPPFQAFRATNATAVPVRELPTRPG